MTNFPFVANFLFRVSNTAISFGAISAALTFSLLESDDVCVSVCIPMYMCADETAAERNSPSLNYMLIRAKYGIRSFSVHCTVYKLYMQCDVASTFFSLVVFRLSDSRQSDTAAKRHFFFVFFVAPDLF